MTYDYSSSSATPGPNSPLQWARASVLSFLQGNEGLQKNVALRTEAVSKIWMGMNLYGMRWAQGEAQPRAIVGREYKEEERLVKKEREEEEEKSDGEAREGEQEKKSSDERKKKQKKRRKEWRVEWDEQVGEEKTSIVMVNEEALAKNGRGKDQGKEQSVVTMYYPSVRSIELRVEMASQMGSGLSLWEIGQGLEEFYRAF